ncbi:MAG TPA: MarR family transcriptional regulator, partial [Pedococcus sp.]|nr:MarR family transcriptional regulator [Pedococcus sp.]
MTRFPGQAAAPTRVERLPFLLKQAAVATDRLLTGLAAGAAGELDRLGASAVHILALVRTGRPVTALAESMRISPQAAGRVVARLEERGLLWRYPHGL